MGLISCTSEKAENQSVTDAFTEQQSRLIVDSVVNRSFTANGEKFLRFEMIVNQSLEETWKLFSTEAGMKRWAAPVVKMDLRVGGNIQTHYDSAATIGDAGTITLGITNYLPLEMITFKIELNEVFDKKCREEDENLQEIIKLESVGNDKTKIISTMIGWGTGPAWDKTYSFFEKGNQWSYEQLIDKIK